MIPAPAGGRVFLAAGPTDAFRIFAIPLPHVGLSAVVSVAAAFAVAWVFEHDVLRLIVGIPVALVLYGGALRLLLPDDSRAVRSLFRKGEPQA